MNKKLLKANTKETYEGVLFIKLRNSVITLAPRAVQGFLLFDNPLRYDVCKQKFEPQFANSGITNTYVPPA